MRSSEKKKFKNPYLKDFEHFKSEYFESINNPDSFFLNKALENLSWFKAPKKGFNNKFTEPKWFDDGKLNISYNCVDRHAAKTPNKEAIIWQGDERLQTKAITYKELLENVSILANGLKAIGVKKGDRVCIYMPMILEAAYSCLLYTSDAADE